MPKNPKPLRVMGIVNVTPDSFSDGGEYNRLNDAIDHIAQLIKDGADIVDIGGESTRPGAYSVAEQEELDRVVPLVKAVRDRFDVAISVDTTKPKVMTESIEVGANIINDVNALREKGALEALAETNAEVCLMHMQGEPRSMQHNPNYDDVVCDVKTFCKSVL